MVYNGGTLPPEAGESSVPPHGTIGQTRERGFSLKRRLRDVLDSITSRADFVTLLADKADPDIFVEGVGPISLPLSEVQAKELITKSHQAPFGKGSETVVDTSVRNTWEINPEQFQIRSPQWKGFLDNLLRKVARGLGISSPISAELYKMLLYEKGAMFKAHTEWLAVTLPSATSLLRKSRVLHPALESWLRDVKTGRRKATPLYYVLNNKYTEANISLQALKTTDRVRVEVLLAACLELGFDLFLTTLEKTETGTVEEEYGYGRHDKYSMYDDYYDEDEDEEDSDSDGHHAIDDVTETNYYSKGIFDLKGNKVASSIPFDKDDIIQEDAFGDEPDEEDYEGYMISVLNSEANLVQCRAIGDHRQHIGTENQYDAVGVTSYYIDKCKATPQKGSLFRELHTILEHLWTTDQSQPSAFTLSGRSLKDILKLCILRNEVPLLKLILANNKQPAPTAFLSWLKARLSEESNISWDTLQKVTMHSIQSQSTLSQRYEAISALTDATESSERVELLISQAVDAALKDFDSNQALSEEDGVSLFNVALYYKSMDDLKALVPKAIHRRANQTSFMLGLLRALRQSTRRKQISQEEARPIFEALSRMTIEYMSITTATVTEKAPFVPGPHWLLSASSIRDRTAAVNYLSPEAMLRFLSFLFEYELGEHLQKFAGRIHTEAKLIKGEYFGSLWMLLFQDLPALLEQYKVPLTTPLWRQAFQSLLRAYLRNFVGKKPPKPDHGSQQVSCPCGDCFVLNRFLADARQTKGRFPMGKQRRQHLHNQLDSHGIDCTHETERRGNPQTLIVTKTTKKWDAAIAQWNERRVQAEIQLEAFDQAKLRLLLADQYDEIRNMSLLEEPPAASGRSAATTATAPSSSRRDTARPVKRSRTALGPASSNPTREQLAWLEAEIARAAGVVPTTTPAKPAASSSFSSAKIPKPHATATSHAPLPAPSHPSSTMMSRPGGVMSSPAKPVGTPAAVPPRTPATVSRALSSFMAVSDGRTTWHGIGSRGAGPGANPAGMAPQHPVARTTVGTGSKRKIVEVIDLTGDD
ncbi:hypothetical protein DL762_007146 [Monosporascus cannonballus]|uniref:Clr5 domain-containing protein n=1 Tax=Monosporascus cannonballus TaxID=155416 RepID=A0ABY0H0T2_9PEZI|nr:hypothetical protein DL762_007146 [Monosporascus cannonballus]